MGDRLALPLRLKRAGLKREERWLGGGGERERRERDEDKGPEARLARLEGVVKSDLYPIVCSCSNRRWERTKSRRFF